MTSILLNLTAAVLLGDPYSAWYSKPTSLNTLPATVGKRLNAEELQALARGQPSLPYRDLTVGLRLPDNSLWVGSTKGLILREAGHTDWKLFHSRRWLPNDHVLDLAVAGDGRVYVKTPTAIGMLFEKENTLTDKMATIQRDLRHYHVRDGLIGRIQLKTPGDIVSGYVQPDDDNDGLWTSVYAAAEAFRFGASGDPEAKANAWRSLEALMFLEKITGISGFVARSFLPSSQRKPADGEWYKSADGKWWWKGDTSNDELAGHYFAYAVYYDLAATAREKEIIRHVVGRITDHIVDHGFYFVGPSGKPTTWGVWAPEKLNRELEWVGDRGLNSLELLSHLKVAHHITGDGRFAQAAKELIDKHGYALNTIWQKHIWPPIINHSDDQLAFMVYYPLLRYERDPKTRAIYLASLEYSWGIERPEHSPLFNLIYGACKQANTWADPSKRPNEMRLKGKEYDRDLCLAWFRDVPQDMIEWTVKNSDRRDLGEVIHNRQGSPSAKRVLNVAERALMRWNGDPYQLDGGSDGRNRDDGAYVLLPYWLGKYHRLLP